MMNREEPEKEPASKIPGRNLGKTRRTMPNYCEFDLYVSGPNDRLEELLRAVAGEKSLFDFDRLIPYPEKFRELDRLAEEWGKKAPEERTDPCPKDGYNQGGYEWCVEHWGTKWNACGVRAEVDEWPQGGEADGCVKFSFRTAWSPPTPVIEHAAERFPELNFELRYFECGCRFQGILICDSGVVRVDKEWLYSGSRGG
jgi:hypothetical protein